MWDSGIGNCVVCGASGDRDILGRCDGCFRDNRHVAYFHFKEMGVANPDVKMASTAHIKDLEDRAYDFKEKRMYYHSTRPKRAYSIRKG